MSSKIYKQKKSENFYFRLVPPKRLQALGAKEFRTSLGTSDKKLATLYASQLEAEKRAEWHALEKHASRSVVPDILVIDTVLTNKVVEHIVNARTLSILKNDEEERDAGLDDESFLEIEQLCAHTDSYIRGVIARGLKSPSIIDLFEQLDAWTETMGYGISHDDPLFPTLVRRFAQAEKEAYSKIVLRGQGEVVPTPTFQDEAGTCLSEMLRHYENHKAKTVLRKTFSMHVFVINGFIQFLGDMPLDSITVGQIHQYFEKRVTEKSCTPAYVRTKIKPVLKTFFDLARSMSLMNNNNPANDVVIPLLSKKETILAKGKTQRQPHTTTQLNAIFAGYFYDLNETSKVTGKVRSDHAIRYFGPIICLLHGVRVREMVQLRVGDFSFRDDNCFIKFTLDEDDSVNDGTSESQMPERRFKNENVEREMPMHPILIRLGFVDYILKMQSKHAKTAPLFPSALPKPGGQAPAWGRAYEQKFLRYVKFDLGFGVGYGNHSFRHQFEDRIRAAKAKSPWPEGVSEYISGRKRSTKSEGSAAEYGVGYMAVHVKKYFESIDFSDINFPPPYAQWLSSFGLNPK